MPTSSADCLIINNTEGKELFSKLVGKSAKWDTVTETLKISQEAPATDIINLVRKHLEAFEKEVNKNGELQKEVVRLRGEMDAQTQDFTGDKERLSNELDEQKKIFKQFLADLQNILGDKVTQSPPPLLAEITRLRDRDEEYQKKSDDWRIDTKEWKGQIIDLENALAIAKTQLESKNLSDQDLKRLIKAIFRRIWNIIKEIKGR